MAMDVLRLLEYFVRKKITVIFLFLLKTIENFYQTFT